MYKLCKSEESALRQRELEQRLLAMLGSLRLDEISVSDLCTQAGISRKVFYRYFSGKEGALYALIDHTLLELENFPYSGMQSREALLENLEWFFRFWQEQKPLLDALVHSGVTGLLLDRMIAYALSHAGEIRIFLPSCAPDAREHATIFSVCGFMSLVLSWHRTNFRMSPGQMAEIAAPLLTKPLVTLKNN